jgi:hypothetical protein
MAAEGLPAWAQDLRWDWPWMAHLAPFAPAVEVAIRRGLSVAQLLNQIAQARGQPAMRFVPQQDLPVHCAYESFIYEQGACPSRDNLHDLFNGLTWLAYPRTKARLNQLQAAQIASDGVAQQRGPLRDALTLFDENGAVLLAPEALRAALRQRAWQRLFLELRPLWRKAMTAHVYLPSIDLAEADLDAALAGGLQATELAEKPYWPLPILGVPGWYLPNENISFYDDAFVFRPAAAGRQRGTT